VNANHKQGRFEMRVKSIAAAGACATGLALAVVAPAAAHVTVSPESTVADDYANLEFSVPHGCEGSPTTSVRVQVPETVPSVTPGRHALWTLDTKQGPKERFELHGETITRGVSEVTYTAKQPLADDELDTFQWSVRMPKGAGQTVYFPVIQKCERGEHRWIQIPKAGESADELEEPAPAVQLTAAEAEATAASEEAGQETQSAAASGGDGGDDNGAPTWLVVVALALGALGLAAGAGGLLVARRARAA
jgi:periplasmic copper chaperone A